MNSTKEELPGLTLNISSEELTGCQGSAIKAVGFITLRVEVNDYTIWDKVLEKLDGMTVYTVNDLFGAVMDAAQRRANRAENQVMKTTEEARQQVDELESKLSFTLQDNENLKVQIQQLVAERDELQVTCDALDDALMRKQ